MSRDIGCWCHCAVYKMMVSLSGVWCVCVLVHNSRIRNTARNPNVVSYRASQAGLILINASQISANNTNVDADDEDNVPCFFPDDEFKRVDARTRPTIHTLPTVMTLPPATSFHISLLLYDVFGERPIAPGLDLCRLGSVVDLICRLVCTDHNTVYCKLCSPPPLSDN